MDKNTNFYERLGVPTDATLEEIRKAKKELNTVWHPDRFRNSPDLFAKAEEITKLVNEAYYELSDTTRRRKYDESTGVNQSPKTNKKTDHHQNHNNKPDIRVNVSYFNFGPVTKGTSKTQTIIVNNLGGPTKKIQIGWAGSPNWVSLVATKHETNVFPLKIALTISKTATIGNHKDELIIIIDDEICAQIPIFATISPVQKTRYSPSPQPFRTKQNITTGSGPLFTLAAIISLIGAIAIVAIIFSVVVTLLSKKVPITINNARRVSCSDFLSETEISQRRYTNGSAENCVAFSLLNTSSSTLKVHTSDLIGVEINGTYFCLDSVSLAPNIETGFLCAESVFDDAPNDLRITFTDGDNGWQTVSSSYK